jgi:hypothetical protein
MKSKQAIEFVNRTLKEGVYGYTLRKYVNIDTWDHILINNLDGIKFVQMTDFNYSRCFSYYFMEDIELKQDFFSPEAKKEVINRGYIEFINLSISAISSFYIIEKAKYVADGDKLKIEDIDEFSNVVLKKKFEELKLKISEENFMLVNSDELRIPLKNVPLDDYEADQVTYFSYLFE